MQTTKKKAKTRKSKEKKRRGRDADTFRVLNNLLLNTYNPLVNLPFKKNYIIVSD